MINQVKSELVQNGARTAVVRGATAPPRPPDTVTVAPGATATGGVDWLRAPLYVTAEVPSGRTIRRYDATDARAAAECGAEFVAEYDPEAVWLCGWSRIASLWGEGIATLLERRLGTATRRTDARFVVWTSEDDEAVTDRYDVVLDA